ncbi:MAG: toll/interleukin-1 receptor domain-containing protein [Cyanobacteria bacterium J06635_1]
MANQQFIFISYRRSDSISEAGRIYDSLSAHFGQECVFKDVFDIPYGVDFVEHLDRAVSQCQILVAVIGNSWVDITNAEGKRRLDDPEDFVRIEIASALNRNILVIPLLVNDAIMPSTRQLPDDLVSLARRNAAQVRHDPDYHDDMNRVIGIIRDHFSLLRQSVDSSEPSAATSPIANSQAQTASRKQPVPTSVITLAVLSFMNGGLSLLDAIDYDVLGTVIGVLVGLVSVGAAFCLFSLKPWGWTVALFAQAFAIVASLGLMFLYGSPGLNLLVPIIAIVIMGSLFRPRIRRFF